MAAGAEMPDWLRSADGAKPTRVEPGPNRTKADIIRTENAAETASLSLTSITFTGLDGQCALAFKLI